MNKKPKNPMQEALYKGYISNGSNLTLIYYYSLNAERLLRGVAGI